MLRSFATREIVRSRLARLAVVGTHASLPLDSKTLQNLLPSIEPATTKADFLHDACFSQRPSGRWSPPLASYATAALQRSGNLKEFRLAQTGEGIKECELVQWFVGEGDAIEEFGRVCEVQSDKATVEITSPFAGTIKTLRHAAGDVVQVGDVLADILCEDEEQDAQSHSGPETSRQARATKGEAAEGMQAAPTTSGAESRHTHTSTSDEEQRAERVLTSPAVRKLVREMGIDLAAVPGTGPQGRITKGDVLAFADSLSAAATSTTSEEISKAVPTTEAAAVRRAHLQEATPMSPAADVASHGLQGAPTSVPGIESDEERLRHVGIEEDEEQQQSDIVVPLRGFRRAMVRSMTAAASVPHFHFCDEVCMDALATVRDRVREAPVLDGTRLTYMPFFIKAAALALAEFPAMNSSLSPDGDSLLQHRRINIGIAVATPSGLVVPNIKNVAAKSIAEIAAELTSVQAAAIANQLSPEEVSGGTFTLSNIGSVGGTYATPLVNPPEAAIMALGRMQRVPRFGHDGHSVVPMRIMNVSLGADHRIVDGATLAGFAQAWKAYVEDPGLLLLSLK